MSSYSPSKIRRQGRRACEEGLDLSDNPYADGFYIKPHLASSADSWEEGWKEAENTRKESIEEENITHCPHCGQVMEEK